MIEISLRLYELYTTTLKDFGLKINPYNNYVANNMTNVNQLTVGWFVNDNKIYHVYDNINTTFVDIIEKKFGKLDSTTGKNHIFWGMNIKFIGKLKVAITTPQNIEG